MSPSSFVTYDQLGRAVHRISKSGHRIEVIFAPWERRLGAFGVLLVASYGLIALDQVRQGSMSVDGVLISAFLVVLSPVWALAAMTLWRRFRIDIDGERVVVRQRTYVPWERTTVLPLRDVQEVSTREGSFRRRLFFWLASGPGRLTDPLWLTPKQLEAMKDWIWSAVTEMVESGAPVYAARDDDGEDAAIGSTAGGPGLAPWPPPPRRVPLWLRVQLVLGARVGVWSIALIMFAPASAFFLYASDVTSPWLFAGPRARTTAVIEACEVTPFRVGGGKYSSGRWVRQLSYRFDADGTSWRSSSYIGQRCPPLGTVLPAEYPVGFPATSRLSGMGRQPLPAGLAPLFVALSIYALGELVASFLAAAREMRFLRWGRITLAVFQEMSPVQGSYGSSFFVLVYRVLVRGRKVMSAYFKDTEADKTDRVQLMLYDPRRPEQRRFTARMRSENLSAFGRMEGNSFGGTLFVVVMLALALLLVFRAIRWTVLHQYSDS